MSFGRLKPFGHIAALLGALALLGFVSIASTDTFDAPVEKKIVDFGLSPSNPPGGLNQPVKLSCWLYPNLWLRNTTTKEKRERNGLRSFRSAGDNCSVHACSRDR